MFCEKCGKALPNNAKFCTGCGAKIEELDKSIPTADSTPSEQQPAPEQSKSISETLTPVIDSVKKGSKAATEKISSIFKEKKLSKKSLILSAIAVVLVVAIIVASIIVLPMINAVKIQNYVNVEFDGEELINGHIEAVVNIDVKQIRRDKDPDIDKDDYSEEIREALSFCELEIVAGDNKIKQSATSFIENTSEYTDYEESDLNLSKLSKEDVIKVKVSWSDDEDDLEDVKDCEEDLGFKFNKNEAAIEFKVADLAKEEKLDIIDIVDFDFYAEFEKHIEESGCVEDEIKLNVEDFEGKIEGTKYRYVYYSEIQKLEVLDENDDEIASMNVYLCEDGDDYGHSINNFYNFSKGEIVKFSLETYNDEFDGRIGETHVCLKDTEYEYTIEGNKPLTAKEAKENVAQLKKDLLAAAKLEGADDYNSDAKYMKSVSKVYFVSSKEDKTENYIVAFTKNNEGGQITYTAVRFENPYYDKSSNFKYSYHDEHLRYEKFKESFEDIQNYYFEPENYKYTEIK